MANRPLTEEALNEYFDNQWFSYAGLMDQFFDYNHEALMQAVEEERFPTPKHNYFAKQCVDRNELLMRRAERLWGRIERTWDKHSSSLNSLF